ncbi:VOC family protein [Candidatus Dependentiae bacterium]|nr:VOC family protein [Candidatus Dependentiae bacterium]
MPKITAHQPGTFCWTDLATTDAEGAKKFYTNLFGWTFEDTPAGEGMTYTMLKLDGNEVAALSQHADQPPHWNTYIAVENVDETVAQAKSLGAQVFMEAFDVMDVGRMAMIQDPTGAMVFLWQPRKHAGSTIVGEPGALCWTELATHDREKASEFYTKLFSWKALTNEVNNTTYTVFMSGEKMVAGMFSIDEQWKQDIPSHWAVFFGVENCKESIEKAVSTGGHVIVEPTPVENFGCFAVLQDPQGATFGIVAMGGEGCSTTEEGGGCC